ncbi:glycosyltransferase family 2 protein [Kovacikia minuta CCNUW1]|uniref:glycosyltransferase family 2 protein n=1 Tax=Kovacikia minuta TaxID=2931930 RepID=UPI001CCD4DE2|nr:glycosyltransferase family 2 protein [Kovacikia minuta]UBF27985.1 glycosyltransferase family 2 protein [Kovacikia minuta CCNUW1]
MLEKVTPLILTYNEAPNIDRTLQQLTWAQTILVIDSFSSDETLEILYSYPQVKVIQRSFDSFANQCNFGLSKIETEWALSIDADYVVTEALINEINGLPDSPEVNGYSVRFKYCVFGKPLRGTLLPPRTVLYRRCKATYQDDGHAHRVWVEGGLGKLSGYIYHDDRKPLSRWLWAQDRYMVIEIKKLLETPFNELSWGDRIRRTKILAPFIILIYCLVLKGGILDGWRGWYYAFQRVLAETLLGIRLIEAEKMKSN